jgi:Protein of unknown function (DUF1647)
MEVVFVTAASENHYKSLLNLIKSVDTFCPGTKMIVYDLGLNGKPVPNHVIYRNFNYEAYPSWIHVHQPCAGQYAWKPIMIDEVCQEGGIVVWCDAGNLITRPIDWLVSFVKRFGIYTPTSEGPLTHLCHTNTLDLIGVPHDKRMFPNRNAACIAIDTSNHLAMDLLRQWKLYSLDKNVIAPCGSDRSNHRQDQSVLSCLYYKLLPLGQIREMASLGGDIQPCHTTHNDVD